MPRTKASFAYDLRLAQRDGKPVDDDQHPLELTVRARSQQAADAIAERFARRVNGSSPPERLP
jgi:hypothetical protein